MDHAAVSSPSPPLDRRHRHRSRNHGGYERYRRRQRESSKHDSAQYTATVLALRCGLEDRLRWLTRLPLRRLLLVASSSSSFSSRPFLRFPFSASPSPLPLLPRPLLRVRFSQLKAALTRRSSRPVQRLHSFAHHRRNYLRASLRRSRPAPPYRETSHQRDEQRCLRIWPGTPLLPILERSGICTKKGGEQTARQAQPGANAEQFVGRQLNFAYPSFLCDLRSSDGLRAALAPFERHCHRRSAATSRRARRSVVRYAAALC